MLSPGNGSRLGVPNILLIITDGQSDNPPGTWTRAVEARRQGISVVAVRITPPLSPQFLLYAAVLCMPHYASCPSVRLSVFLFLLLAQNQKEKRRETEICTNVSRGGQDLSVCQFLFERNIDVINVFLRFLFRSRFYVF